MDNDRLKHSYAVAKKMMDIAIKYNLSEEEIENCFLIGVNHDIGYEFTTNGINHNKIGGQILKKMVLNTGKKSIIMVILTVHMNLYI